MTLDADSLEPGRVYQIRDEHLDADLRERCAGITGEDPRGPVLSVASVLALRTLMASQILPQGAVMLGYEVTWLQRPPWGGPVRTSLTIDSVGTGRRGRASVTIGYGTVDASERPVLRQRQEVLWPTR